MNLFFTDKKTTDIPRTRLIYRLWTDASWVAREHATLANVGQTQIEHHHAFQADPASAVWESPITEGVDVGRDRLDVDAPRPRAFLEEFRFVDALGTG